MARGKCRDMTDRRGEAVKREIAERTANAAKAGPPP
jgi:hypothetical protein